MRSENVNAVVESVGRRVILTDKRREQEQQLAFASVADADEAAWGAGVSLGFAGLADGALTRLVESGGEYV